MRGNKLPSHAALVRVINKAKRMIPNAINTKNLFFCFFVIKKPIKDAGSAMHKYCAKKFLQPKVALNFPAVGIFKLIMLKISLNKSKDN